MFDHDTPDNGTSVQSFTNIVANRGFNWIVERNVNQTDIINVLSSAGMFTLRTGILNNAVPFGDGYVIPSTVDKETSSKSSIQLVKSSTNLFSPKFNCVPYNQATNKIYISSYNNFIPFIITSTNQDGYKYGNWQFKVISYDTYTSGSSTYYTDLKISVYDPDGILVVNSGIISDTIPLVVPGLGTFLLPFTWNNAGNLSVYFTTISSPYSTFDIVFSNKVNSITFEESKYQGSSYTKNGLSVVLVDQSSSDYGDWKFTVKSKHITQHTGAIWDSEYWQTGNEYPTDIDYVVFDIESPSGRKFTDVTINPSKPVFINGFGDIKTSYFSIGSYSESWANTYFYANGDISVFNLSKKSLDPNVAEQFEYIIKQEIKLEHKLESWSAQNVLLPMIRDSIRQRY